jgi:nitroreductase
MEAIENILSRRSVKAYTNQPISKEAIEKIIQAGSYAATGRNAQSPIILAITNKQVRDEMSKLNAKVMGAPEGTDPFYGAPVVLVVLADKSRNTYVYDGSLVMGNLMLAAESLGLGSCWIQVRERFTASGVPSNEYVHEVLDIPLHLQVLSIVAVGHKGMERKPFNEEHLQWEKIHLDKYGCQ